MNQHSELPPDPKDESEWQNPTVFFDVHGDWISIHSPEAWKPGALHPIHWVSPSNYERLFK